MIRSFRGKQPQLAPDVFVADGAQIIGDVIIGARSSVWFNTVVRGDVMPIRIGAETNLQDNCTVHVSNSKWGTIVGDCVTVGHQATLHGCTVGNTCLIGIGSIVMDGVEIGDESMVAAGSLVTPGTKIGPRMLALGSPARAVRPLTDAELSFLRENAANYVSYASLYRGGGE